MAEPMASTGDGLLASSSSAGSATSVGQPQQRELVSRITDPGGVGGVGGLVWNRFASSDPGGVGGLVWNRFASVRW